MGILWAIIAFTGIFLLYHIMRLMVQKETQKRFQDFYKSYLEKDMLDFYREMESYGLLLQNRLESFKNNIKLHQKQLAKWEEIYEFIKKTKKGKEIADFLDHQRNEIAKISQRLEKIEKDTQSLTDFSEQNRNVIKNPINNNQSTEKMPQNPERRINKPEINIQQTKNEDINYEDFNIAEEILKESLSGQPRKDPIDRQIDLARTLRKSENSHKEPKKEESSTIIKFAETIGKTLGPVLGVSNRPLPETANAPKARIDLSRPSSFEVKLNENLRNSANQVTIDREQAVPSEKKDDNKISKINPEELTILIQKMQSPGKDRINAMQNLINYRFTLQDISDFSGIPLSELETTRNIYKI